MFRLHDTTRRWVCRIAFLSLGVMPTLLIGGWCWSRHWPSYVEANARLLGRQLGLDAKLGGFRNLRPGVCLYEQLELFDPETREPILRCRRLEVARQATGTRDRTVLVITASQLELEAASLGRIWQCLQYAMEGLGGPLESDLQFSAADLTLRASTSQTLTDVSGGMKHLPGGMHAQLEFRLAGVDTPGPARIRLVRNREISPPASGFELYTGGGELPCNVLAMGLKELKPLGSRCRFRGYIWANETPDGWQGEVTGQLVDLDLGALVSDYFPHKLSGIGEATIQSARFHRGRLEDASATLLVGPGTIERSLVAAAIDRLGLVSLGLTAGWSRDARELLPYDKLALSAMLDPSGLRLSGRCDTAGTILSYRGNRLLGEPAGQVVPVVALVQTLVPHSMLQVPASRQTDWLLRHLPLPTAMPAPGADTAPPYARLHLGETLQR